MTFTHQPTTAARSPHNPSVWPCLIVDGPVSGPWVCLSHLPPSADRAGLGALLHQRSSQGKPCHWRVAGGALG